MFDTPSRIWTPGRSWIRSELISPAPGITKVRSGGTTTAALAPASAPPIVATSALGAPAIEKASRSPGCAAPLGAVVGGGAGEADGVPPLLPASSAITISTATSPSTTAAWIRQRFSTLAERDVREGWRSSLIGRAPPRGYAPRRLRERGTGSAGLRGRARGCQWS